MKSPHGFGKHYFLFASIQAHITQIKLEKILNQYKELLPIKISKEISQDEDSPDISLVYQTQIINSKPCHCNSFFNRKTTLMIHLFKFIPRCPYYDTFFAFRRSGVHPPKFSF